MHTTITNKQNNDVTNEFELKDITSNNNASFPRTINLAACVIQM